MSGKLENVQKKGLKLSLPLNSPTHIICSIFKTTKLQALSIVIRRGDGYNKNITKEITMTSIVDIEGIGSAIAEKLRKAGIRSTNALLDRCGTAQGRKEVASATGIESSRLLEWVNHADLYRVKGIGSEYSDLLERAGVDTTVELAQRNATALYETLVKTNDTKKLVRKLPTADQVAQWVKQAKSLPRAVEY
jgi:predicted flap endonuclease-1-like 5' DNA nuclease